MITYIMDLPLGMYLFEITTENFICSQCGELSFFKDRPCKNGKHCKECHFFNRKCNYIANKERDNNRSKKYNKDNRLQYNHYHNNRAKTDINFKLARNIRIRIRIKDAIKHNYKSGSAIKDLGCSVEELRIYLESKFRSGMTWDNWKLDGWHIDHIKPLSKFNLSIREQFLEACHYTNLQPLWAKDNLSKGNR